jgi:hypothetical protein
MKRKLKLIANFNFGILFALLLTSCLKGNDENLSPTNGTGTNNVVELGNTTVPTSYTTVYPLYENSATFENDTAGFPILINWAGSEDVAPTDITVTLAIDTAALNAYNSENSTDYIVLDSTLCSFSKTVTIAKGTRYTKIRAIVNDSSFDFSNDYALPITITSSTYGTISGNYGIALYSFAGRNLYDGAYTVTATSLMYDSLSSSLTGLYPFSAYLITDGANSVALYDNEYYGTYDHPIKSGSSSTSYYGSFSPVFTFDSDGNVTSVTNYYGDNAGSNKRSAKLNPSGVNKVTFNSDGSINYIEVSYIMTQSVTSSNLARTYFYEKFTYTGAR